MPSRARTGVGHEGAKEATVPGAPREREVITPDWAHLDKNEPSQCVPGDAPAADASARSGNNPSRAIAPGKRPKGPAIDRHR
ncbi:MAG: hypothetical protein ACM4AI_06855 [Acidobacteriota bacterium]